MFLVVRNTAMEQSAQRTSTFSFAVVQAHAASEQVYEFQSDNSGYDTYVNLA
jgi:hypothetical protein